MAMLIIWSVIELKAEECDDEWWKQMKAQTVCFEDYKWGQTFVDTKNQLKNKNKNFVPLKGEGLAYFDKIFGESCNVTLIFTPKSKLLAAITVSWDATSVGSGLKTLLTKKYGSPSQLNQFMEKYSWFKFDSTLILDYSFTKTDLFYYGGECWKKHEQETAEITEKEIDGF
ncbi:MAG: hypothetical protein Q7J67_00335 [bacterium]|nr:hypothetical protein [bacterium]